MKITSPFAIRAPLLLLMGLTVQSVCRGELLPFRDVPPHGPIFSSTFVWSSATTKFRLSWDGELLSVNSTGSQTLRLPVKKEWSVDKLFVGRFDSDLLLAYETSFGGEGRSYICRARENLKAIRWCQKIPGFNVAAASNVDSIWIGAFGFMGRIDPESGRYAWSHKNLYNASTSQGRSFIEVSPYAESQTTVTFQSGGSNQNDKRTVVIDRKSGRIVQVTDSVSGKVVQ
jgi:hypothetical protein